MNDRDIIKEALINKIAQEEELPEGAGIPMMGGKEMPEEMPDDEMMEEDAPQVTCYCECDDCEYNEDMYCVAEKIELKYSDRDDGKIMCECMTYSPTDPEIMENNEVVAAEE